MRVRISGLIGTLMATMMWADLATAQTWPERPVKVIIPFPPGGATDVVGRPWMEQLTKAFGQPFIIENRGGAGWATPASARRRSTRSWIFSTWPRCMTPRIRGPSASDGPLIGP